MLRSLLISSLSACLAVFTTLQYQAWISTPPSPADTTAATAAFVPPVSDNTEQVVVPAATVQQDSITTIDTAQALGLGRVLLARGEAEEAALAFHVAYAGTSRNNHKGEAKHGLGLALRAAGRSDEALEACREAELLDPQLAAASACIGTLLTEAGDGAGALKALRSAATKVDDAGLEEADVNGRLGAALVAAGEVDEAIPVLRRALATAGSVGGDARHPHVAYNLGVAWQSKGETDKAIAAYTQAVEMAPSLAPARVNLGAQLLQSGRLRDAEAMLLTAVKFGDDAASLSAAHSNLGAVFERSGRLEEALEAYSQAVRWGAGRSSLLHMAKLHQSLGQPEQALEASRRAMERGGDQNDASPLLQAGLILESLGKFEEAADHFAKVTQLDADSLEATMHLGNCQRRLGRHHEALDAFLRSSRLDPGDLEIYDVLRSTVSDAQQVAGGRSTGGGGGGAELQINENLATSGDRAPKQEGVAEGEPTTAPTAAVGTVDEEISATVGGGEGGSVELEGVEEGLGTTSDGATAAEDKSVQFDEQGVVGVELALRDDGADGEDLTNRQPTPGPEGVLGRGGEGSEQGAYDTGETEHAGAGHKGVEIDADGEMLSPGIVRGGRRVKGVLDAAEPGQQALSSRVAPPEVAGLPEREAVAEMRRRSESLSRNDETPLTGGIDGQGGEHALPGGPEDPANVAATSATAGAASPSASWLDGRGVAGPAVTDASAGEEEAVRDAGGGADGVSVPRYWEPTAGGTDDLPGEIDTVADTAENGRGTGTGASAVVAAELARGEDLPDARLVDVQVVGGRGLVLSASEDEAGQDGKEEEEGLLPPTGRRVVVSTAEPERSVVDGAAEYDDAALTLEPTTSRPLRPEEHERGTTGDVGVDADVASDGGESTSKGRSPEEYVASMVEAADGKENSAVVEVLEVASDSAVDSFQVPGSTGQSASHGVGETADDVGYATPVLDDVREGDIEATPAVDGGGSVIETDVIAIKTAESANDAAFSSSSDGNGFGGTMDAVDSLGEESVKATQEVSPEEIGALGDGLVAGSSVEQSESEKGQVHPFALADVADLEPWDGAEEVITVAEDGIDAVLLDKDSELSSGAAGAPETERGESQETTAPVASANVADSEPWDGAEEVITVAEDGIDAVLLDKDSEMSSGAAGAPETERGESQETSAPVASAGNDTLHVTAKGEDAAVGVEAGSEESTAGQEGVAEPGKGGSGTGGGDELTPPAADVGDGTSVGSGSVAGGGDQAEVLDGGGAAADTRDGGVPAVSEEEAKRARSKVKLGLARFQQGQTARAAALFEKSSTIDPGWWGGFYYTALAQDTLQNTDAAARALISALGVPPPVEAGEVAELAALASKVLSSLSDKESAAVAAELRATMDASELEFDFTASGSDSASSGRSFPAGGPSPTSQNPDGSAHNEADSETGKGGGSGGVGRMGRSRGGAGGAGAGLEADLAKLGKGTEGGGNEGLENTNTNQWPISGPGNGRAPAGDRRGPPPAGGAASRGTVPGTTRGETSPPRTEGGDGVPNTSLRDSIRGRLGEEQGSPNPAAADAGLRDSRAVERDAQANKADGTRRRGWGIGGGGGGRNSDRGRAGSPETVDSGRGQDSNGGAPPVRIDPKASAEDILASMGLKSGLPFGADGLGSGVGAGGKTPQEMMDESRGRVGRGGKEKGGGGGEVDKKGLFGRLFKGW